MQKTAVQTEDFSFPRELEYSEITETCQKLRYSRNKDLEIFKCSS